MIYRFRVHETCDVISRYVVEASSLEEAQQKALEGDIVEGCEEETTVNDRKILGQVGTPYEPRKE